MNKFSSLQVPQTNGIKIEETWKSQSTPTPQLSKMSGHLGWKKNPYGYKGATSLCQDTHTQDIHVKIP